MTTESGNAARGPVVFAYDGSDLARLAIRETGRQLSQTRDALVLITDAVVASYLHDISQRHRRSLIAMRQGPGHIPGPPGVMKVDPQTDE
jgi:hypothetical protein